MPCEFDVPAQWKSSSQPSRPPPQLDPWPGMRSGANELRMCWGHCACALYSEWQHGRWKGRGRIWKFVTKSYEPWEWCQGQSWGRFFRSSFRSLDKKIGRVLPCFVAVNRAMWIGTSWPITHPAHMWKLQSKRKLITRFNLFPFIVWLWTVIISAMLYQADPVIGVNSHWEIGCWRWIQHF